jgi:hypothetical protein
MRQLNCPARQHGLDISELEIITLLFRPRSAHRTKCPESLIWLNTR